MTAPRQVLPGSTYMVTRRCSERRFFLRPSELVNQVFTYCLAYAAQRTGVLIHSWVAMSNHWHAVLTDPHARLPEFMECINKLVGKCINAHLGRWESLWSSEHFSAVRLETDETVMAKLLYTLANPLQDELVESWSQWPGAISGPRACASRAVEVRRPTVFFRDAGQMPKSVRLEATVPPCFGDAKKHSFAARLARRLEAREAELREELVAKGRKLLGREAVLAQDPFDRPKSFEPRRGLNPRVACADKWRRVEALSRLKAFLEAYRRAREAFVSGKRNVEFPAGTYWLRRHAGCKAASPG